MGLMITKVAITIFVVVLLAEVSKRTNPTLGGLLLGLPLGVGLSVYFIAYTEGVPFVIEGIPWSITGLASGILFCFIYLVMGKALMGVNRFISMLLSSMVGFIFYFASGYLFKTLNLNLLSAIGIFAAVYIMNILAVKNFPIQKAEKTKGGKTNPYLTIFIRGLLSGLIIAAITGTASIVGSQWAGIFSAFPSMTYVLILVLHFEEGEKLYPSIIYGFSYSVSTLAVFYILSWYLLPRLGLNLGFAAVYVLCLVYLLLVKITMDKLSELKNKPEIIVGEGKQR